MAKTFIPSRFIKTSTPLIDSSDYILGVKRVNTGGGSGTWVRIDRNRHGHPIASYIP